MRERSWATRCRIRGEGTLIQGSGCRDEHDSTLFAGSARAVAANHGKSLVQQASLRRCSHHRQASPRRVGTQPFVLVLITLFSATGNLVVFYFPDVNLASSGLRLFMLTA